MNEDFNSIYSSVRQMSSNNFSSIREEEIKVESQHAGDNQTDRGLNNLEEEFEQINVNVNRKNTMF